MGKYTKKTNKFYLQVLQTGIVYSIKDDEGIPAPINTSGKRAMPFWSERGMVEKVVSDNSEYKLFKIFSINLEDYLFNWLPGLHKDDLLVGLNWSGENVSGYDVSPLEVKEIIESLR